MKPKTRFQPSRPARRPSPPQLLRVSVVRYLNTAPLVWGLDRGPERKRYRLSFTVPAACAEALRTGAAEVGIVPSIEYQRIPTLKIIPGISVASEQQVQSVLLVSRGPARKAKKVALDTSSRTSVALTKILFARHWHREPDYAEAQPDLKAMLAAADAALLIGDPALRFTLRSRGPQGEEWAREENLHIYDLAEEWARLTNLPFVFAFWAVRGDRVRDPRQRQQLTHSFQRARDLGLEHLPEIAHQAAVELGLPGRQLERYLRTAIQYRLDARHQAGLEYFFKYAHELGLIEQVRPLEFL